MRVAIAVLCLVAHVAWADEWEDDAEAYAHRRRMEAIDDIFSHDRAEVNSYMIEPAGRPKSKAEWEMRETTRQHNEMLEYQQRQDIIEELRKLNKKRGILD